MMKPCLDCGTPTNGNRCPAHATQRRATLQRRQTATRKQGGPRKYGGAYRGQSAAVRANATVCWLCGQAAIPGDPWQADHLQQGRDTGATGPLAPAHRSCNIRRRHLADKGWTTERIRERLTLLQTGPNHATQGSGGQGTHPHPGHRLAGAPQNDPAPLARRNAYGVGRSGGSGGE